MRNNGNGKVNMTKKATRVVLLALLFVLSVSIFLYAGVGDTSKDNVNSLISLEYSLEDLMEVNNTKVAQAFTYSGTTTTMGDYDVFNTYALSHLYGSSCTSYWSSSGDASHEYSSSFGYGWDQNFSGRGTQDKSSDARTNISLARISSIYGGVSNIVSVSITGTTYVRTKLSANSGGTDNSSKAWFNASNDNANWNNIVNSDASTTGNYDTTDEDTGTYTFNGVSGTTIYLQLYGEYHKDSVTLFGAGSFDVRAFVRDIKILVVVKPGFAGGSGTSGAPYILANRRHFDDFSGALRYSVAGYNKAHYEVVADDSNGQTEGDAEGNGGTINMLGTNYVPCGLYQHNVGVFGNPFQGSLDGNGCYIYNLVINMNSYGGDSYSRAALIGTLSGNGVVKNLTIGARPVSGSVTYDGTSTMTAGRNDVASVVGYLNSSTAIVQDCTNYATITVPTLSSGNEYGQQVGGVVANIGGDGGIIRGCKNFGSVYGRADVGGIVGIVQSANAEISHCYNSGAVTAAGSKINSDFFASAGAYVGGITGSSKAPISYCYNKGTVYASAAGIGFAGGIVPAYTASVTYCYNTGLVSAASSTQGVGAIAGHNPNEDTTPQDLSTCWAIYEYDPANYSTTTGFMIGENGNVSFNGNNVCTYAYNNYTRGRLALVNPSGTNTLEQTIEGTTSTYERIAGFNWTMITTMDIEGFRMEYEVPSGYYAGAANIDKSSGYAMKGSASITPVALSSTKSEDKQLKVYITFAADGHNSGTNGVDRFDGYYVSVDTITKQTSLTNNTTLEWYYGMRSPVYSDWLNLSMAVTAIIYYNDSTTLPTAIGTYTPISIDIRMGTSDVVTGTIGGLALKINKNHFNISWAAVAPANGYGVEGSGTAFASTYDGQTKQIKVTLTPDKTWSDTAAFQTAVGTVTRNTGLTAWSWTTIDGKYCAQATYTTTSANAAKYTATLTNVTNATLFANYGLKSGSTAVAAGGESFADLTINKKTISAAPAVVITVSGGTYNGSAITPTPTVKWTPTGLSAITMTVTTDYTVSYSNNINAGNGTVTITGAGTNYTGTASTTFAIGKKALSVVTTGGGNGSFYFNADVQGLTAFEIRGFVSGEQAAANMIDTTTTGLTFISGTPVNEQYNINTGTATKIVYNVATIDTIDSGSYSIKVELGTAATNYTLTTTTYTWSIADGDYGHVALDVGAAPAGKWGSAAYPYLIRNATELNNLRTICNGGTALNSIAGKGTSTTAGVQATAITYAGAFFKVEASFNCGSSAVEPIGNYVDNVYQFAGTFDGNGKEITSVTVSAGRNGLFGLVTGAGTIKNLTVRGSAGNTDHEFVGGVVGELYGTVDNCVSYTSVVGTNYVGGIAGIFHGGTISNCENHGTVTGNHDVGGIAGRANSTTSFVSCENYGTVSQIQTSSTTLGGAGGIVGRVNNANSNVTINGCSNAAAVYNTAASDYVGGIVGCTSPATNAKVTFTGTISNSGAIGSTKSSYVGGIIGYAKNCTTLTASNSGKVQGSSYIGGIAGYTTGCTVSGCSNSGQIITAGIAGSITYNTEETYAASAYDAATTLSGYSYTFNKEAEDINKLFDSNTGTKFCQGAASSFSMVLNLGSAKWLVGISWTGANDTDSDNGRRPYVTAIYGSNSNTGIPANNTSGTAVTPSSGSWERIFLVGDQNSSLVDFKRTNHNVVAVNAYQYIWVCVASTGNNTQASEFDLMVENSAAETSPANAYVGGIAGYADGGTLSCNGTSATPTNSGWISALGNYVGGVAGYCSAELKDSIYVTGSVNGTSYVGGIVGYYQTSSAKSVTWNATANFVNAASTLGDNDGVRANGYYQGGAIGMLGSNVTILGSIQVTGGDIDGYNSNNYVVGGIIGYNEGTLNSTNFNTFNKTRVLARGAVGTIYVLNGKIVANGTSGATELTGSFVGGIVGFNAFGATISGTLKGSASGITSDTISLKAGADKNYLGGIAAYNAGSIFNSKVEMTANYGTGVHNNTTYGYNYVGGIAGYSSGALVNCDNRSLVAGNDYVGGIVGYAEGTAANKLQINWTADYSTSANAITGASYVGGIAGGTKNVSVGNSYKITNNSPITGTGSYVGGIIGGAAGSGSDISAIYNCTNLASITSSGSGTYVGGITGFGQDLFYNGVFVNGAASTTAKITATTTSNVGGITGRIYGGGAQANAHFTNYMEISGASVVGGIVGYIQYGSGNSLNVSNAWSINYGKVTGTGNNVGGIAGQNSTDSSGIANAVNSGAISGANYVGGIVGTTAVKVEYCYNSGTVNNTASASGGIAGSITTGASMLNCYNTGSVTGTGAKGGVLGANPNSIAIPTAIAFYAGAAVPTGYNGHNQYYGKAVLNNINGATAIAASIKPYYSTEGINPSLDWTDIRTVDINGFRVVECSVAENKYYKSYYYDASARKNTYYAPETILTNTVNNDNSISFEDICYRTDTVSSFEIIFVAGDIPVNMNSEYIYSGAAPEITIEDPNAPDGVAPINTGKLRGQIIPDPNDDFNVGDHHGVVYVFDDQTAGEYHAGDKYTYGVRPIDYTITPYNISTNYSGLTAVYNGNGAGGGAAYGTANPITSGGVTYFNMKPFMSNANDLATATNFGLINSANHTGANFGLQVVFAQATEMIFGGSSNLNVTPSVNAVLTNGQATITGTGNYTGTVYLHYVLIDSDFGGTPGTTWGSAANPFLITHWAHLVRLSEIVNGTSAPINSVGSTSISSNTRFEENFDDGTAACFFEVRPLAGTSISVPSAITFLPIGNGTTYDDGYGNTNAIRAFGANFNGDVDGDFDNVINVAIEDADADRDYVGLFGYIRNDSYNDLITITNVRVNGDMYGANYVGGVIGRVEGNVRLSYIQNTDAAHSYTVSGTGNYVGGLIGYLGAGVDLALSTSGYINNGNTVHGANYVGGVIGAVVSGAGTTNRSTTYTLGTGSKFENTGAVSGTSYVGGIIGGISRTINGTTIGAAGNYTVFNPLYARNTANIAGTGNYVGGIVGEVGANCRLELVNGTYDTFAQAQNWSYNGAISTTVNTVSGVSYVGGIAGAFTDGQMQHVLTGVFSTANVSGTSNVGGLVGSMENGVLTRVFVADPTGTNSSVDTSKITGNTNVGGLVGRMNGGSMENGYMQGFLFASVNLNRGGLVGLSVSSVVILDSWTVYLVNDPTYQTRSANDNGKFIIADSISVLMNFKECLISAGLIGALVYGNDQARATIIGNGSPVAGLANSVSVQIPLPEGTISGTNYNVNVQIVFYDASGYEVASDNVFSAANNGDLLYIRVLETYRSFSICKIAITFGNITDYSSVDAWQNAYISITQDGQYFATITELSATTTYTGKVRISYRPNFPATNDPVFTSRVVSFTYGQYSEPAPLLIKTQAEWDSFATSVKGGSTFAGQFVKLATNSVTVTTANLAGTNGTNNFRGTFDGDGYSITASISGATAGQGVFPYAGGGTVANPTTIKNLTVTGTVTTTVNDVAAFVGQPGGNLTFENCTNEANVTGSGTAAENANFGGFVGTTGADTYTFIACVNKGNISGASSNNEGAVAGIVGNVYNGSGTVIIESCRNTGSITSPYNTGGLIGRINGTATIQNSANSGSITATSSGDNINSNSGGLVGKTTSTGKADFYACYNTGNVRAFGNKAGGIIGTDCEGDTHSFVTKVYYCYNTGSVTTRETPLTFNWSDHGAGVTTHSFGVQAGGIVGSMINMDIRYCYNAGMITVNGIAGSYGSWDVRVGGIAGYTNGSSSTISNCYNVGLIVIGSKGTDGDCGQGAGGIIGQLKSGSTPTISSCYSIRNCVYWQSQYGDVRNGSGTWQEQAYKSYPLLTGTILDSLADLTASYSQAAGSEDSIVALSKVDCGVTLKNSNSNPSASGESIDKLFDNNTGTKFCSTDGVNSFSFVVDLGSATFINGVSWTSGNDTASATGRAPTTTRVFGTNDGSLVGTGNTTGAGTIPGTGWTELWVNGGSTTAQRNEYRTNHGVSSTTAYKYYWIYAQSSGTQIQVSEFDIQKGGSGVFGNESSSECIIDSDITSGTKGGWLYVYGCLPQLAVFAVDTQNGLAMTSVAYGRDNYGNFKKEQAGGEFNPYVIKDGIDLLGLSALLTANSGGVWTAEGKYFEFANGSKTNGGNNLDGSVTQYINMPDNATRTDYYKFYDEATSSLKGGKSYHLFTQGAICGTNNGDTLNPQRSDPYQDWVSKNYSYNTTTKTWSSGTTLNAATDTTTSGVNFYSIGTYSNTVTDGTDTDYRPFKGYISGAYSYGGADLQTEIRKIKVANTIKESENKTLIIGGLFAGIDNATVEYITVTGEIKVHLQKTNAGTAAGTQYASYAGIVGRALNGSTLRGLQAGTSDNALTVLSTEDGRTVNPVNATGGIVGWADSGSESGTKLTIENCVVLNATITGFHTQIGGILGRSNGTANTSVDVKNCTVGGKYDAQGNEVGVETVTIQSTGVSYTGDGYTGRADTNSHIGGILGSAGTDGIVTFDGCEVGDSTQNTQVNKLDTAENSFNVRIYGENAVGGIVSDVLSSELGTMSFNDCYVYGDVLLKRRANSATVGANTYTTYRNLLTATDEDGIPHYSTAFGGIIGYSSDSTMLTIISGEIEFYGKLDVSVYAGSSVANDNDINYVQDVGGVIGYMGAYTAITTRAGQTDATTVKVLGTIDALGAGWTNANSYVKNVGGAAGFSNGGCFNGNYIVSPTISAASASYVGGFIGQNSGDTYITRTATITTGAAGAIVAYQYVGGFVGGNNASGTAGLHVGAASAYATTYGTDASRAVITLGASVDGLNFVGGFLGVNEGSGLNAETMGNFYGEYATVVNNGAVGTLAASVATDNAVINDNFGGVIGCNTAYGSVELGQYSSFSNAGQVGKVFSSTDATYHQNYVGGVLGSSLGAFQSDGALGNTGNVYGNKYVGGSIGALIKGTLGGTSTNGVDGDTTKGKVYGNQTVGGVIGVVMQLASISDGTFTNWGTVTGYANVTNLGGIIGIMFGAISGSEAATAAEKKTNVNMYNHGDIVAVSYAGGTVGVIDGTVFGARFVNDANITYTGGNSLGGSIGYITSDYSANYPAIPAFDGLDFVYDPVGQTNYKATTVNGTYFSYQQKDGVTTETLLRATGAVAAATGTIDAVKGTGGGGLGGVIGTIDATDIKTAASWANNSYFVRGSAYGGTGNYNNFTAKVDGVGGVVGKIVRSEDNSAPYVSINNMLVYSSVVAGKNYVGGIIGYNGSSNVEAGAAASIYNCYNVNTSAGASVNILGTTANKGGIVGGVCSAGSVTPVTYSAYWVVQFTNDRIKNSTADNLGTTLSATWVASRFTADFMLNNPDPSAVTEPSLNTTKKTWPEYIAEYNDNNGTDPDFVLNANEDYGYYTGGISYSTGNLNGTTGYYFVFSSDAANYSGEIINTRHEGGVGVTDLDYWKLIANTTDKTLAYQANSTLVSEEFEGGTVFGGDVSWNGVIIPTYIFATAVGANGQTNNGFNSNGYYLYIDANDDTGLQINAIDHDGASTTEDNRLYLSANATVSKNVMIFYKQALMQKNITYNGEQRYTPINDKNITYNDYVNYTTTAATATDAGKPYYSLQTIDAQNKINVGTDAGDYYADVMVWYVDQTGRAEQNSKYNKVVLGYVASSATDTAYKWTIKKRDLEVKAGASSGGTYNGKFDKTVVITVSNVVNDDDLKMAFSYASSTAIAELSGTGNVTSVGYRVTSAAISASTAAADCEYTVVGGQYTKATNVPLKQYTYTFYFKNAVTGSYTVKSGNVTGTTSANYNKGAEVTNSVSVSRVNLSVTSTTNSWEYNGEAQIGATFSFGGYIVESGAGTVADSFASVQTAVNNKITATNQTKAITNATTNSFSVTVSATNKNNYTATLASGTIGTNYNISSSLTKQWAITTLNLKVDWGTWSKAATSGNYEGTYQTYTVDVIQDKGPNGTDVINGKPVVTAIINALKSVSGVTIVSANPVGAAGTSHNAEMSGGASANLCIKVSITMKNAATYSIQIGSVGTASDNYYLAADTGKTHTINKATLTVDNVIWTDGGSGTDRSFVYNTAHQGVQSFAVTGVKTGDTLADVMDIALSGGSSTFAVTNNGSPFTVSGAKNVSGVYDTAATGYMITITSTNTNYQLPSGVASVIYKWVITKKEFTFSISAPAGTIVYDGLMHYLEYAITGNGATQSGSTVAYGSDTIVFTFSDGTSDDFQGACNAGTYNITTAATNFASATDELNNPTTDNYTFGGGGQSVQLVINKCPIYFTWSASYSFVYQATALGPAASTMKLNVNGTAKNVTFDPAGETPTVKTTGVGSEGLTFGTCTGFTGVNVNTYTATIAPSFSVDGNNATNKPSTAANYQITDQTTLSKEYTITKSVVKVDYNKTSGLDKVYDGSASAAAAFNFSNSSNYTVTSTNGGAKAATFSLQSAVYASKNAGGPYTITLVTRLDSTQNYDYPTASTTTYSGSITKRAITVNLNNGSNGRLYKTYDNTNAFGTAESNGSTNANTVLKSNTYRTGRGFTFSNVVTSGVRITMTFVEADRDNSYCDKFVNGIIATKQQDNTYTFTKGNATYKRIMIVLAGDDGANYYVSNVKLKDGNDVIVQDIATAFSTFYLQDSDETDSSQSDNSFKAPNGIVVDIRINTYYAQASYYNTTQSYANTDNSFNKNWQLVYGNSGVPDSWGAGRISLVVINKWMFVNPNLADYNLDGSTVDADGNKHPNYNENLLDTDLYDNAISVRKYTRISGSTSTNAKLRAFLTSTDGSHLNVTLKNQPSVIIGYFVDKTGYEIGTLAGLLLATEYYKGSLVAAAAEGETLTPEIVTTVHVISELSAYTGDDASTTGVPATYPVYGGASASASGMNWGEYIGKIEDYYRLKFIADNPTGAESAQEIEAAADAILETFTYGKYMIDDTNESETEVYHYFVTAAVATQKTTHTSFVQVADISGVFSASDIEVLNAQFGSGNWGSNSGSIFLKNVVFSGNAVTVGSVVTFLDSVFVVSDPTTGATTGTTFTGNYNGAGFVIDKLNIVSIVTDSSAATVNVGMFGRVSAPAGGTGGNVTGVNLRNANIMVFDGTAGQKILNVGGIVGLNQSAYPYLSCSFQGQIIVNGNADIVNAGGIIGLDNTKIENVYTVTVDGVEDGTRKETVFGATSIATIFATGAKVNAGGIVGGFVSGSTGIANVVSLSEIYANATTAVVGGFIGQVLPSTLTISSDGLVDTETYPATVSNSASGLISALGRTNVYLTNAVYTVNPSTGAYTAVNKSLGNQASADAVGKNYSTIYAGSKSLYAFTSTTGNVVYVGATDNAGETLGNGVGVYDVLTDYNISRESGKYYQSMRLADIIDVYVLQGTLETVTLAGNEATTGTEANLYGTTAYMKSNGWVVGSSKGTASSAFGIAYQQHVSLLRLFSYMNFSLNRDVTMYAGYDALAKDVEYTTTDVLTVTATARPIAEAFSGTVEANGHKINVRLAGATPVMFASQTSTPEWLKAE